MKKLLALFLSIALIIGVLAATVITSSAACTLSSSVSKSEVYIGETVTVTFTFKDSVAIGGAEGSIDFDSSKLEYVKTESSLSGGDVNLLGSKLKFVYYDASASSKTFTIKLTFKAKAIGEVKVKMITDSVLDVDLSSLGNPSSTATVNVKVKNKSSDATLAHLASGDKNYPLSPAYSANVTNYSVTVPYEVTMFTLSYSRNHSAAKTELSGSAELKVGENTRSVKVTAEDGTTKTYTVKITRLPKETADTTPEPTPATPTATPDAQEITIDGVTYSIVEITLDLPEGFIPEDYTYGSTEVPSAISGSLRVFQLNDGTEDKLFLYRNNRFVPFYALAQYERDYVILEDRPDIPHGFFAATVNVGGVSYPAWQHAKLDAGYYLINVVNSLGDNYCALYCDADKTVQRIAPSFLSSFIETATPAPSDNGGGFSLESIDLRIVLLALAAVILLVIIIVIIVIATRSKASKRPHRDWKLTDEDPYDLSIEDVVQEPKDTDFE